MKLTLGLVTLLLLVSLAFTGFSQANPSAYSDLISEGNSLMKAGKFEEATGKAMQAIQMDGNNYRGYALRAFILSKQGQNAESHIQIAEKIRRYS